MQPDFKAKLIAAALITIRGLRTMLKFAIIGLNRAEGYVLSKAS